MTDLTTNESLVSFTAEIVQAHVSNNSAPCSTAGGYGH